MFLRSKKPSEGWAFVSFGIGLCVLSVLGFMSVYGPLPEIPRSTAFAFILGPAGIVSIIIGAVKLFRDEPPQPQQQPREQ